MVKGIKSLKHFKLKARAKLKLITYESRKWKNGKKNGKLKN